jgi:hypothetical protein
VAENQDPLLAELLQRLDAASADELLDVSFDLLREPLELRHLWLYVVDYAEEYLRPVPNPRTLPPPEDPISLRGSVGGRAYMSLEVIETDDEEGLTLWVPIFRRTERLGVVAFGLKQHTPRVGLLTPAIALAIGAAVVGAARYSDVFEIARGAHHLSLAAALQWELLPLPIYRDSTLDLAGRVEPAYDIGGDAFDFAANPDGVEIAVFDAMGHGLKSTLLTTMAVGSYRFARRRMSDLGAIAQEIDQAVVAHPQDDVFVTGHLCRLHHDGRLEWLNAGHPLPLLLRDHAASPLGDPPPMLPFGLQGKPHEALTVQLQPGDIVLFYSDGVIEARPDEGGTFGVERFLDMAGRHGHPDADPFMLVRQILDTVKEHANGVLRDDATLVAVRWQGRPQVSPGPVGGT